MGKHSVAEAKSQLSALIDRVLAGDEVVITRDGAPVVELRPVASSRRPQARDAQSSLEWIRQHRVRPSRPQTVTAADLIRQMRDEGP